MQGPRFSTNSSSFTLYLSRLSSSNTPPIALLSTFFTSYFVTMALQLVHTPSSFQAFSGLRASPSVRQVDKASGVGFVKKNSGLQSIKAVMNPLDDPIVKEAMKEPLAFLGGVFAGLLRLDLNEEPLRDWVAKTAEAAGIDLNDSQAADFDDAPPEDIQID